MNLRSRTRAEAAASWVLDAIGLVFFFSVMGLWLFGVA